MGKGQFPDDVQALIERQITQGRAPSETEFLIEAARRYAEALESDEDAIIAAAEEGIADIEAGRFQLISSPEDMDSLESDLSTTLDRLAKHHAPA